MSYNKNWKCPDDWTAGEKIRGWRIEFPESPEGKPMPLEYVERVEAELDMMVKVTMHFMYMETQEEKARREKLN